jgi:hypothetical protein
MELNQKLRPKTPIRLNDNLQHKSFAEPNRSLDKATKRLNKSSLSQTQSFSKIFEKPSELFN